MGDYNFADIADLAETVTDMVIQGGKAGYEYYEAKETQKDYKRAERETKDLNELNERAEQARAAEEERRALADTERQNSLARARAGAQGVDINRGSTADYLAELESENLREFDWLKQSNVTRLDAMKRQGKSQVNVIKSQGKAAGRKAVGAVIGGVAGVYEAGADAGGWYGADAWYTS